jgi:hypothetical protein
VKCVTRSDNAPAGEISNIRWGGKKCAKSALSTLSYPELPFSGYVLVLIPHGDAVCGKSI